MVTGEKRMRQIKFRAWSKPENAMIDDFYMHSVEGIGGGGLLSDKDDYTLMQYTGLKDKNGKEIYEGDVLDLYLDCDTGAYYAKAIVTWNNEVGAWFIKWVKAYNGSLEMLTEDFEDVESREVIGNIYENPELTNKQNH